MTAINASPKATPFKPRLLWRGSLFLPDGTALPGVAMISNVPPCFSSQSEATSEPPSEKLSSKDATPPLTLSREEQDALSLSIEMIRHAPINISEIIQDVQKEEDGTLNRPKRLSSSSINVKERGDNIHVSYQAGGGIRMYIDPYCLSTVAYMDRIFCYENDEDNVIGERDLHAPLDGQRATNEGGLRLQRCSNSVITLSLDRSYRFPPGSQLTESEDVFLGKKVSHTIQSFDSTGSIEAAIIGIKTYDDDGIPRLELHIGQKVVRKLSKVAKNITENKSWSNLFGPRPDDPAPRGLSRMLSAKYSSSVQPILSRQASLPSASSKSQFLSPALPTTDATAKTRTGICNTDPNDESPNNHRSSSMPTMKRHSNSILDFRSERRFKASFPHEDFCKDDDVQKIEEQNRSLIKKLVHHQLLGKGLVKKDQEYLKCFNPTCNGTALALRGQFKTEVIERSQAASIIEKHLDMYL